VRRAALSLIRSRAAAVSFIWRNLQRSRALEAIPQTKGRGVNIRGMGRQDVPQVHTLYALLNDGVRLSWPRRFLYRVAGSKLVFVASIGNGDDAVIVGMNMYYFNNRDVEEDTIHGAFVGVSPAMTGRGIATDLRRAAMDHFSANGIAGISSRISLANDASLKSALNLGYQPVERYYDPILDEERCYLVRPLSGRE